MAALSLLNRFRPRDGATRGFAAEAVLAWHI